jgi:type IV pilus assembly protein PilA
MRKNNRKGFTIVELVIVIAVIAILAGVLIPTFGGIITKAQESAALQKASASYKEAYAVALSDDGKITTDDTSYTGADGIVWTFGDGTLSTTSTIGDYKITVTSGVVSVTKS